MKLVIEQIDRKARKYAYAIGLLVAVADYTFNSLDESVCATAHVTSTSN